MKPHLYAQALIESTLEHPERLSLYMKNLEKKLSAEGKKDVLKSVAKEVVKLLEKKRREETVVLTVAHEKDLSTARKILSQSKDFSSKGKNVVEQVNPALVGGTRIETGSIRIDGSYKRALLNLYDSLVM